MSRLIEEPRIYRHADVMDELNKMSIRLKIWLNDRSDAALRQRHPKPTVEELDDLLLHKIYRILQEDNEPMRKK